MNINFRKRELLQKYLSNECTRAELEELFDYLQSDDNASYEAVMKDLWNKIAVEKTLDNEKANRLLRKAVGTEKRAVLHSRKWYRLAAAVLALAIAAGGFFLLTHKKKQPPTIAQSSVKQYSNDIKPGSTKAILKAGNSQVVLNKRDTSFMLAGNVVYANSGNVKVAEAKPVKYTLIVPRGGNYSLVLADGTKVWLNADSKLTYPSVFEPGKREVSLEGEAYFEVEKDAGSPFTVHTKKQTIKVLGTQFNVKAYGDEDESVTTLVNGKVQVSSLDKKLLLAPGQQAATDKAGRINLQQNVDVEQVIAWKKGYFLFRNIGLHEIMRDLSRWYNVKVSYEKGVKHQEFMAIISRDNNISQVLGMLEATGAVHFEIRENEVVVKE